MPTARRVNWARFRVAAVCLVASLILLTLFYLLTGGTLFQPKATLYVYVSDATGISAGSPVRVDGIGVGKVASVALTGLNQAARVVKITITVERSRLSSIPLDSFAQLSTDTLIGDKFVDITSGKEPEHLAANAEIPFKDSPELMKSLDLSQFQQQLRVMDATLTDIEQGKGLVGQFVMTDTVYNDLMKKLGEFRNEVHAAADASSNLGQMFYSDAMYRQIRQPVADLEQSLARIQSGQGPNGQLFRDTAQYEQLRASAQDFLKSLTSLRQEEMLRSDRMYTEWNRTVTGMIQMVDQMNASPMLTRSDTYEGLNGAVKEMQKTVKDFREHPAKYLRLKVF